MFLTTPAAPAGLSLQIECHRFDLDRGSAGLDLSTLDARERRRAGALRFERDRRRYVTAHVRLREILAARLGLAPAALPLAVDSQGKPWLNLAGPPCHFSLSHSGNSGWLAIAPVPVGIDVEQLKPCAGLPDLIEAACTPAEAAALLALDEDGRHRAFLTLWTRKEAALKAWGSGLGGIEPASLDVGLASPGRACNRHHPALALATLVTAVEVISIAAPGATRLAFALVSDDTGPGPGQDRVGPGAEPGCPR